MVSVNSHPAPEMGAMKPPPFATAMPRRPTIGSKRDSSFIDTDDESGLSLSTKKLKVAFDPRVDIRIMDDSWGNKSMDLVREEIKVAIDRHVAPIQVRSDEQYIRTIEMLKQDSFGADAVSSKLLVKYIVALEARVSTLGECGKLVIAVLDISWLGRDEIFLAAYTRFLVSLASAHVKYLQPMLERLVAVLAFLPSSTGRLPSEEPVSRSTMFGRLHMVVKAILHNIPAAGNVLLRAIRSEYPNELATTKSYNQYQRHLLRLADCATEIKPEIMAIIVQRLVALDVQIQQDIEDLEDDTEDRLLQRQSSRTQVMDDSDESDAESVASSEDTRTEEEERLRELRLKVAKMDATMDLLFSHYSTIVQSTMDVENDDTYRQLMAHFETFILPNRTRHAQFLLFHFSQTTTEHITTFAQQCIEAGFGTGTLAQKCSAIAYLSSFVARGAHVPRSTTQQTFIILADYMESMRKQYEPNCHGPDRRAYMVYYAVAQALLYIFCFRWRDLVMMPSGGSRSSTLSTSPDVTDDLLDDPDDLLADRGELEWYPRIKDILRKSIFSILNPLRVCAPAIVTEFANISRHVRFIEVISKLESNKRLRLGQTFSYYGSVGGIDIGRRETAWDRKKGDAHHQMEPYFPFDPYNLPVSKKWLDGDYNEWRLPRDMKREDDDDDYYDDDDDASETDSDEESLADQLGDGAELETASLSS